jgi:hypothetical protein
MNFIILSHLDGPIRVEKTNPLLKTYIHRCEPAKDGRGNLSLGKGNTEIGFANIVNKPKLPSALRSSKDIAKDRELEIVSNIMELYIFLAILSLFF